MRLAGGCGHRVAKRFSRGIAVFLGGVCGAMAVAQTALVRLPGEEAVPLLNGGFDEGMEARDVPTGWRSYKAVSEQRLRRLVPHGEGTSLELVDNDTREEIGVMQTFPAKAGAFYRLEADTRRSTDEPVSGVQMQLRFLPSNTLSQVSLQPDSPDTSTLSATYLVSPDDTTEAVVYLYTSRADTPAIIIDEVRVFTAEVRSFDHVTAPQERIPETRLVRDGAAECVIVTPAAADWQAMGQRLAAVFAARNQATVTVVSDREMDDAALAETTPIVIGNICNNRALLYPYSHSLLFSDEMYPGEGGYEIRSIHDPWGKGRNMIALSASDPAGAERAVAAFSALLPPGDQVVLESFLDVDLRGRARELWQRHFTLPLDEAWMERQKQTAEDQLVAGIHGGLFTLAIGMGQHYAMTRREPYAQMFAWLIQRAATHHASNPSTYGGPWGMDSDFRIHTVFPAWDAVEECPALDDATRLEVTRILYRWVRDLQHKGNPPGNRVRFNHITFPALGCLYAGQYFQKHYDVLQGELWIQQADAVFRFQAQTTKPHCDCNSYQWLPIHHTMLYSLARGDLTYFENNCVRECAEYVMINMNGLGYQAPYGDVGNWRCWGPSLPILQIAHWYYRDARTAWSLGRKREVESRLTLGGYNTTPEPGTAPEKSAALTVWPVTEPWYNTFAAATDTPFENSFDKIVFRDGYQPDDTYLLLDGLARGGHGHMDANALIQWTSHDRVWLADTDYIKSLPKFHNTMLILKNGQSDTMPAFCELHNAADLPALAATRTSLNAYTGSDWERSVLWFKGRYIVVLDRITANEAANYSLRAVWQTLGRVTLDGSVLDIEQSGQHARIAMPASIRCMLHDDHEQGKNWTGYTHADPVVRVMQGVVGGELAVGEARTVITVLHASGDTPSDVRVEQLPDNRFRITGAGDPVLLALPDAAGRIVIPGIVDGRADVLAITPERAWAIGLQELLLPEPGAPLPPSSDVEIDLSSGRAILSTPARIHAADSPVQGQANLALTADRTEVAAAIMQQPAITAPRGTAAVAAGAPHLPVLWQYEDAPASFLVTGNGGAFGSVDAGMSLTCSPEPLAANVFSGERGSNRIENVVDGQFQETSAATMWDDDQEVTIDLAFAQPLHLRRLNLDAWFATGSTKGKTYQLGRLRLLLSNDGFQQDSRLLLDRRDDAMHPSWGTPIAHEFADLDAEAQQLRLILTPRPGTAIYIAELRVHAAAPWLSVRYRAQAGEANPFPAMHVADVDADRRQDILLGAASGHLICLDATGAERWRYRTGASLRAVSSIATDPEGTRLVVAGGDEAVAYGIDAAGNELWRFPMPRYKRKGMIRVVFPADVEGTGRDVALFGADNWRYYALDAAGRERWHYETVHPSTAGCAVDLDGDGKQETVLGTAYYWWSCVGPDGDFLWRYRTAGGPGANAVAAGDISGNGTPEILFGGADTLVQAVDAKGKSLWNFSTGDEVTAVHCVDADGDGTSEVLVASLSFNVYALDGAGALRWQRDLGSPVLQAIPVTFSGRVALAAGCGDGRVVLVRASDGEVLAQADTGSAVLALAQGDGFLCVSTQDGQLIALELGERENR